MTSLNPDPAPMSGRSLARTSFSVALGISIHVSPSLGMALPDEVEATPHPPAQGQTIELIYESDAPASASQGTLNRDEVQQFPVLNSQDLLEVVPGLHVSHHGGHGKAAQFFVRGFDAVHGSDLAVSLEGIPLNEVSNIHGQGYLDLHFLPTSLVGGLSFVKGPLPIWVGDCGVAAHVNYDLGVVAPGITTTVTVGTDRSLDAEVTYHPRGGAGGTFIYAGGEAGLGVGESKRYTMARAGAGLEGEGGSLRWQAFSLVYSGTFQSPGVLRVEDIESGVEGFYGAYDGAGGGDSFRWLTGAKVQHLRSLGMSELAVWGGLRQLELRHNFTGFYYYPDTGDGLRQTQDTLQGGASIRTHWALHPGELDPTLDLGADLRIDGIHQTEGRINLADEVWQPLIDADILQLDRALWGELAISWRDTLRLGGGIRVDAIDMNLWRYLDNDGMNQTENPSRIHSEGVVASPRLSIDGDLVGQSRWYLGYRRGFRSPDARGIEGGDELPITLTDSWELGLFSEDLDGIEVQTSLFGIWIDNELVFDHTAGRFLASGATRRLGGEFTTTISLPGSTRTQVEVSYTDGRYLIDESPLPFAPRWLTSVEVFSPTRHLSHLGLPPSTQVTASVRGWYMGRRPLPGGFVSQPAYLINLNGDMKVGRASFGVDIQNLLGTHWRDGEFVYPSRFDAMAPRSELPVLHITAGTPRAVFLTGGWSW